MQSLLSESAIEAIQSVIRTGTDGREISIQTGDDEVIVEVGSPSPGSGAASVLVCVASVQLRAEVGVDPSMLTFESSDFGTPITMAHADAMRYVLEIVSAIRAVPTPSGVTCHAVRSH